MKRGLAGLVVFTMLIGVFALYLGMEIVSIGDEVSDTGGAVGNEMAALGGLWTAMGMVLAFLGILCFPLGLGIGMLKEWGRKNGVYMAFFIAAICVVAGMLIAYFDIMESIIYFVLTVLALICGQMLRERRNLYELGADSRRMDAAPTFREVRHVEKKVVIRQSKDAVPMETAPPIKCSRCGTVNESNRERCKMCANTLTGVE